MNEPRKITDKEFDNLDEILRLYKGMQSKLLGEIHERLKYLEYCHALRDLADKTGYVEPEVCDE